VAREFAKIEDFAGMLPDDCLHWVGLMREYRARGLEVYLQKDNGAFA
jgi:hypothetical protein